MNDKFFKLPDEKKQRILNAAFKVFSENSYKKASMSEIASQGDISKSLLFYYFRNKQELFLYLWNYSMELTRNATLNYQVLETDDFFQMLQRTLSAKCSLMEKHPHIYAFSLNAYYEQSPDITSCIQKSYALASQISKEKVFQKINTTVFRQGIDINLMYQDIMFAMEGYLLQKYRSSNIHAKEIQIEVSTLIQFWKSIYT